MALSEALSIKPTIKGIFVNSHVAAVKKKAGTQGVAELEKRFGKSVSFGNNQDVRILDEVRLIEHALDIMSDTPVPQNERTFKAGRLHFDNFVNTAFAKMAFPMFKNNFKTMMMKSSFFGEHIFKGVTFTAKDLGGNQVEVVMGNNDYPIDHFRGVFQAWMDSSGLKGVVTATTSSTADFIYTMEWK